MKFRTKLLLLILGLAIVTNSVLFYLAYAQASRMLRKQVDSTALSIAATAGALVDGDAHRNLQRREQEGTPEYTAIERDFRKVRDANRREDVYVKFVYSIRPDSNRAGNLSYVVDGEEKESDKSHFGDHYDAADTPALLANMGQPYVVPEFIQDEWGTWLTASAPIRSRDGTTVASMAVDISAADVKRQLNRLLLSGLAALAVSVVLAVILALVLARRISQPLSIVCQALSRIGSGDLETRVEIQSKDEFGAVATAINDMTHGLRQRAILKGTLVRYVSSHVAEKVLSSGKLPDLDGERRRITVLFADVRGFTALSERLAPEEVVSILNEYFDKMVDAISQNQGSLDKFIGDGLMAVFGAWNEDARQEEHAVAAALDMRHALKGLQEHFRTERQLELKIGIGIHSGIAIVGNIGSKKQKLEFTAIGDTVNLASRLEAQCKELGTDIVISESTCAKVKDIFEFQPLGSVQVKGRNDAVNVFGVVGAVGAGRR